MTAHPTSRGDRRLAVALWAGAFLLFLATERSVGFPRDESVYFAAAESYAGWFSALLKSPQQALTDAAIVSAYDFNHEHPALLKNLFGLSFLIFHEGLGVRPATAMRLPALALSALIPALLFLFGSAVYGRSAGLFAALSFLVIPRQFFHSHLSCFDMPVAALWLWVVYAYWRSLTEARYSLWCGVLFGLALATKHNALFLPFVLAPFSLFLGWKHSRDSKEAHLAFLGLWGVFLLLALLLAILLLALGGEAFLMSFDVLSPQAALLCLALLGALYFSSRLYQESQATFRATAPIVAMAALGPLLFYLHWPYLWHHPVERTAWYLSFHAQHNHYAWLYLGTLLRSPPFPLEYVLVKTALTVPISVLLPMALGLCTLLVRAGLHAFAPFRASLRAPSTAELLVGVNALASIAIISHPQVPHFGGVKHWFPSMLFLSLLAGDTAQRAGRTLFLALKGMLPRVREGAWAFSLSVLLLLPAGVATVRNHPYGTAFYSELAGGVPGAASLGMQRQFWSSHVTAVLDWLNAHGPKGARLFLHEVNGFSFRDYQRNGMLRSDFRPASGPRDADVAVYQYHQEFREQEFNIWQEFGTTRPAAGFYLDQTPQVVVYQRR